MPFWLAKIDFLGHTVNKYGIQPLPSKDKAINEYARPNHVKALERFIGMVNFYHGFKPQSAEKLRPLYQALAGGKTRQKILVWSEEMLKSFNITKEALANARMLHHPIKGAPTALTSDASDTALGAVLEQKTGN